MIRFREKVETNIAISIYITIYYYIHTSSLTLDKDPPNVFGEFANKLPITKPNNIAIIMRVHVTLLRAMSLIRRAMINRNRYRNVLG